MAWRDKLDNRKDILPIPKDTTTESSHRRLLEDRGETQAPTERTGDIHDDSGSRLVMFDATEFRSGLTESYMWDLHSKCELWPKLSRCLNKQSQELRSEQDVAPSPSHSQATQYHELRLER